MPAPTFSHLGFIGDVIGDAIAVSFVAFATSYAMAKILAERDKEEVNANQVNLQIYSSLIYLDTTFSLSLPPALILNYFTLSYSVKMFYPVNIYCPVLNKNQSVLTINQSIISPGTVCRNWSPMACVTS